MAQYHSSYPPDCFNKIWPPIFSKARRIVHEDYSYGELARPAGADGNNTEIFFQILEGSPPCVKVEEIIEAYQITSLDGDISLPDGTAGTRPVAWLDDRSHDIRCCQNNFCSHSNRRGGERFRRYKNPLTARELHQRLKVPVWN